MLFSSRVSVRVCIIDIVSGWLVSGYAHAFVLVSVVMSQNAAVLTTRIKCSKSVPK